MSVGQASGDFRSDTVTRPSPGMLAAMAAAEVGDDVLDGDPTVARLEAWAADWLGKDGALDRAKLAAFMAAVRGA